MPKVARDTGLVPNQGVLAVVAALAVDDVQVLPLELFRLSVKSTLPLFPVPGFDNFAVVFPDVIMFGTDTCVSQAVKLFR